MRKMFAIIMICLFCITAFAGCRAPVYSDEEIPEMQVEYIVDEASYNVTALIGTSSWSFGDMLVETDSFHPLECIEYMPEIESGESLRELRIVFTLIPDSYTVVRWEDIYVNIYKDDPETCMQSYETVSVFDDVIILPNDNKGYIYEVQASWPQGNAYYCFYVK